MPEILLIDDDATQLRLREAVLCEAGFAVLTSETAHEALALLGNPVLSNALRLIITDHLMPGPSGASFALDSLLSCLRPFFLKKCVWTFHGTDRQFCAPARAGSERLLILGGITGLAASGRWVGTPGRNCPAGRNCGICGCFTCGSGA